MTRKYKTPLQKRHFDFIATTIHELLTELPEEQHRAVATHFATALSGTNSQFSRLRFLDACGVQ